MGRELRRVPLDFDWPLKKVWDGYLMSDDIAPKSCPHCTYGRDHGSGMSAAAWTMHQQWYGYVEFDPAITGSTPFTVETPEVRRFAERNITNSPNFYGTGEAAIVREAERLCSYWNKQWMHHLSQDDVDALCGLVEVDGHEKYSRLHDFTHVWEKREGDKHARWHEKEPPYIPTADEVNRWSITGMGHDSINSWRCIEARCQREGVESRCIHCDGSGELYRDEAHKQAYDSWERTHPPTGEGYQMWETTSEGSPISPVFATPEELAEWLVANNASSFGGNGATYEQWMNMIMGDGWAPSAISVGGEFVSGVEGIARLQNG